MGLSDRDLLAKTLMAEAGNQGIGGMMDVGSVIMNRANTTGYGDGVRGVIMKPGQFSAWNGTTGYAGGEQGQNVDAMQPSAEIYKAADMLLSGNYNDQTGGATHYYNDAISQPKWGASAGGNWQRRGDHVFGFADAGRRGATPQPTIGSQAMQVLGKTLPKQQRSGILATPQKGPEPMQQQQPRGLLGSMGIQKMQEGAEGETGQRFYQRDSFKDTAAKMGQAFAALGSNPGVQKFTNDVANQRTETKSRNKTIDYLRANGMGDMADMVEAGNLPAGGVLSAIIQKRMAGPKGKDGVTVGKNIIDRNTGEMIYQGGDDGPSFRAATPEEAARYQAASGQIDMATGRFYDTSPSGGFSVTTGPDGTTTVTQGGRSSSKSLTEAQGKATGFFGRATASNVVLDDLELQGTELRQFIAGQLPFGNYLRTPEGQRYDQAQRDFINAILRQESGAVIAESEFDNAKRQYFPQPGDTTGVVDQKRKNRVQAIRGIEVAAGTGADEIVIGDDPAVTDSTPENDDPLNLFGN